MIRESLIKSGNWNTRIVDLLCMQVAREWREFRVPEAMCEVDNAVFMWRMRGMVPEPLRD